MSDRDEFGAFLVGFIVGGLTGAVAALLFAPQSGEDTRAVIRERSIELRDKATAEAEDAWKRAEAAAIDARTRAEEYTKQALAQGEEITLKARKRGEELIDTTIEKVKKVSGQIKNNEIEAAADFDAAAE